MRYVIIRDDDTNALTPPEFLDQLYRPFLEGGMPVNLAVIPEVSTQARMANGQPEGFLLSRTLSTVETVPIQTNQNLVRYLHDNPGYQILQHGLHHNYLEFDQLARNEIAARLDRGTQLLVEAGFSHPQTFVAPYDKLSRASMQEVAARFRVLSTGWYELRRLPFGWWPRYALKKLQGTPHWRVGRLLLLSHPGCLLSYQRAITTILDAVIHSINTQHLTVLVTHWWEYFRDGKPDQAFIDVLHQIGHYMVTRNDIKVISFSDLLTEHFSLN